MVILKPTWILSGRPFRFFCPSLNANCGQDRNRAVYTVKFSGWVYVLHCFQKKSKSGIKTPKEDMELIHARLKAAKLDFEAWQTKQGTR